MKRLLAAATMLSISALGATQARAVPGDAAWGACVWQNAPASAAFWLNMEQPTWQDNLETPSETLGFRLIAMCDETRADELRPNHIPDWRRLRSRLRRTQPEAVTGQDAETPSVELCSAFAILGEERGLFRIDIVRVEGAERAVVFQQYFDQPGGSATGMVDQHDRSARLVLGSGAAGVTRLRLPQDLRALPEADATVETECKAIRSDGTLIDA